MKTIPLTKGKNAIVDDDMYQTVNCHKWQYQQSSQGRNVGYACRPTPRIKGAKRTRIYLHREILGVVNGQQVDHINGDRLDCRKANLRLCTAAQNQMNRRFFDGSKRSKHRGVVWYKLSNKWGARITLKGKECYLGQYEAEEDAAIVADVARQLFFGAFYCPSP